MRFNTSGIEIEWEDRRFLPTADDHVPYEHTFELSLMIEWALHDAIDAEFRGLEALRRNKGWNLDEALRIAAVRPQDSTHLAGKLVALESILAQADDEHDPYWSQRPS